MWLAVLLHLLAIFTLENNFVIYFGIYFVGHLEEYPVAVTSDPLNKPGKHSKRAYKLVTSARRSLCPVPMHLSQVFLANMKHHCGSSICVGSWEKNLPRSHYTMFCLWPKTTKIRLLEPLWFVVLKICWLRLLEKVLIWSIATEMPLKTDLYSTC